MNSLGINKEPKNTRVVVAMSGGVDSSVVAAKLKTEGYDVIGITMQLYSGNVSNNKPGKCCGGVDINDAIKVSRDFDFPHYVFDYEDEFKKNVIDDFTNSYVNGLTPVPCIRCNETVKFSNLLDAARNLNADCMATGHYVRRKLGLNGIELHTALDNKKDQSYFLFATTLKQLEFLRFPLGDHKSKETTRSLAENLGLKVANKPDSQDICFIAKGKYFDFIQNTTSEYIKEGPIYNKEGQKLGTHKGIANYTIGQRKGLGISSTRPLYVTKIDVKSNSIIVGYKSDLVGEKFKINNINWLGHENFNDCPKNGFLVDVKVRSTRPPKSAEIYPLDKKNGLVTLKDHEESIAPGQACVFYEQNSSRVLGGGWISN